MSESSSGRTRAGLPLPDRQGPLAQRGSRIPFGGTFLFFCFFPYISIVPTMSDLQPYALLMSLAVCMTSRRGFSLEVWLLAASACVAFVLWLADDRSFFGFREFLTFFSLATVTAAAFVVLRSNRGLVLLRHYVVFASCCWLIVGLIERLVEPSLVSALIPNISLDSDRGVTGLATEPSFYGTYCLCLLGLNYLCNKGNRVIALVLLFQIVVLAQSSIAILLLIVFATYWLLFFISIRKLTAATLAIVLMVRLLADLLPQLEALRVAQLPLSFIGDPIGVLETDGSLNARLGHSMFSVFGFFDNWGIPYGFNHFHHYVTRKSAEIDYVWLGKISPDIKIMSGYGSALFELGAFGLLVPISVSLAIVRYFGGNARVAIFVVLYVTTIMFSAIQLSLPLLGLLLGVLLAGRPATFESSARVADKGEDIERQ